METLVRKTFGKSTILKFDKVSFNPKFMYKAHLYDLTDPLVKSLKERILKLKPYEKNWDSYGAEKISIDLIMLSFSLIEYFGLNNFYFDEVIPMRDGGIQLEKSFLSNCIELEIHPNKQINLLVYDNNNNLFEEILYSFDDIESLFKKLKNFGR